MSPEQFTIIKQHIESSAILNDNEKKEWLFLLPRMTEGEMKELDRILSIKLPSKAFTVQKAEIKPQPIPAALPPIPPPVPIPVQKPEAKTQTSIAQLPKHPLPPKPPSLMPISPLPTPPPRGEGISSPLSGGGKVGGMIAKIQPPKPPMPPSIQQSEVRGQIPTSMVRPPTSDLRPPNSDLAKLQSLSLEDLRREPSIYIFLEHLNGYILALIGKRTAPADILQAFEKSPLHKTYIQAGVKLLNREKSPELSQEEFETLTDFRTALKKLG